MSNLKTIIKQVIKKVEKHKDLYSRSEQSVRDQLINPILQTLGWDTSEPDLVHTNVRNDDGKIPDYTFFKDGNRKLILEAKKLSKNLEDSKIIRQLADYCYPEGIEFGILTDGIVWQLFNTFEKNPSNRIVWTVDIRECNENELMQLEMICYDKIEYLDMELNQVKALNNYFTTIFHSKDTFLNWCESALMKAFINDNKPYKFSEEAARNHILQKLNLLLPELSDEVFENPEVANLPKESVRSVSERIYDYYNQDAPFDLTSTKIVDGRIGQEQAQSWIQLLNTIIKQIVLSGGRIKDICVLTNLNISENPTLNNNFVDALKKMDANRCGKAIWQLAKKYDKRVDIEFVGKNKGNDYGKIVN